MNDQSSLISPLSAYSDSTLIFSDWILPVSREPIERGFLAFSKETGQILALGKSSDLSEEEQGQAEQFFEENKRKGQLTLLTPGLVNTHAHLELSFETMIPLKMGEDMTDWLFRVIAYQQKYNSREEQLARSERGLRELLKTGTTCVNDISSQGASLAVLEASGLRGVVSMEFFHPAWERLSIEPLIQRYESIFSPYKGHCLIGSGLSPHSLYNVSPKAWKAMVLACEPQLVHAHCAESLAEMAWLSGEESSLNRLHEKMMRRRFSPEPFESAYVNSSQYSAGAYLETHGLLDLGPSLILAHCVYTQAKDRAILAEKKLGITHCPRSNLNLQGRTLAWNDWSLNRDIVMSLGTDSRLSSESLDLREEARQAVKCHGWTSKEALVASTLAGAKAMGLGSQIGSLEIGKEADLAYWRIPVRGAKDNRAEPETLWLNECTQLDKLWVQGSLLSR